MTLWRRIKNLWRLSEYRIDTSDVLPDSTEKILIKDFATIKKKLATIIPPEKLDIFAPDD